MNKVALTFDDGPSQWTAPILDLLAIHDAKATFFVLGTNIGGYEGLLERMAEDGHEVGVHGWDHTRVKKVGKRPYMKGLITTTELIRKHAQQKPVRWRPPWHEVTAEAAVAAEMLGLCYCGVTIDGYDVSRVSDVIVENVAREITDGAIIGLHDGVAVNGNQDRPHRQHTVAAVKDMLEMFAGQYRFVTVSEILR